MSDKYGALVSKHDSDVSSLANLGLLRTARLDSKIFNRNTNVAGFQKQEGGTCYAHAAASAYLNSCATIYPQEEWPSWNECFEVAVEGRDGGFVHEALARLEKKFNMGIEWKILENGEVKIRDVLMTSIVICFHTTEQGFCNINAGKMTKKPFGIRDPTGHATLIESFDFESRYYICKNSWGDLGGSEPRFQLDLSALHDYTIYQVYWTRQSLAKKKKPLPKKIYYGPEETKELEGYQLQTQKMDEKTALFDMNYICQMEVDHGKKVWVGYEVDKLIEIKLKTTPKLESPKGSGTDLPYAFLPDYHPLLSSPHPIFFPDVKVTKVGANSTKFDFLKEASGTLLVDQPITKGVVRWTVLVEYGVNSNSRFAVGAVPNTGIHKYYNFLGDVAEAMTFSFGNKDRTMRSCLSGIQKDQIHLIDPRETMVEHTSTVSIEVDCNMRIISFFVNDVKVPHVITEIGLPLYVGMSVAGRSDMSFTTLSLCHLSSSTPSIVKLTMHKALLPADFAKKETEYDERVASLQALADARERERAELQALADARERERAEKQALADTWKKERAERALADAWKKERTEQALADARKRKRTEERALADARERERAEKQALADAWKKERAERALADARKRERAEERALADARKRKRAEERALADARERERAEEQALADAWKRERAEERALADVRERRRVKTQSSPSKVIGIMSICFSILIGVVMLI